MILEKITPNKYYNLLRTTRFFFVFWNAELNGRGRESRRASMVSEVKCDYLKVSLILPSEMHVPDPGPKTCPSVKQYHTIPIENSTPK